MVDKPGFDRDSIKFILEVFTACCPASALIGQNGWIEEGRDFGPS